METWCVRWGDLWHVCLSLCLLTGCPQSPMSKATLTLITVCTCVVAVVYGTQTSCPLTVKITLHVPEHFIADGEKHNTAAHSTFLNYNTKTISTQFYSSVYLENSSVIYNIIPLYMLDMVDAFFCLCRDFFWMMNWICSDVSLASLKCAVMSCKNTFSSPGCLYHVKFDSS